MHLLKDFFVLLKTGGLPFLFLLVFLEGNPILGSFIPGQLLVIFIGFLIATSGIFNLYTTVIIIFIASFLGDLLGYYLGRKYGLSGLEKFGIDNKSKIYTSSYSFFEKYGPWSLILGREFNLTRAFMPFFAGCFKMRWYKYLVFSILSSILWTFLSIFLGYYFGYVIVENFKFIMEFVLFLLIYIGLIIFLYKNLKIYYAENTHIFKRYAVHNMIFFLSSFTLFISILLLAKFNLIDIFNNYFSFLHFDFLKIFNFLLSNVYFLIYFFAIFLLLFIKKRYRMLVVYFWSFIIIFFFTLMISIFLKRSYDLVPYFSLILFTIFAFYTWIIFKIFLRKSKYFRYLNILLVFFIIFALIIKASIMDGNYYLTILSFLIGVINSELILLLSHYQVLDKCLSDSRFDCY